MATRRYFFIIPALAIFCTHATSALALSKLTTHEVVVGFDSLSQSGHNMKEVQVNAVRTNDWRATSDGGIYWDISSMSNMPHVMGSADPLRQVQLLPGVTTGNDYSSGINIQGCQPGHNLILMDGAPVYNASHLLGLFSVFTASHFRGLTLEKSRHTAGMANRLGGMLAFISTDSLVSRPHLNATFSFLQSEGTLTLPLGKKSSVYLSGRGSYLNLLYSGLLTFDEASLNYGLKDFNATWLYHPSALHRLKFSFYGGNDKMRLHEKNMATRAAFGWNNLLGSVNHTYFAPHALWRNKVFVSRYANNLNMDITLLHAHEQGRTLHAGASSEVETSTGHEIFNRTLSATWTGGVEYSFYRVMPMHYRVSSSFIEQQNEHRQVAAHEMIARADVLLQAASPLQAKVGVRATCFHSARKAFFALDPRSTLIYRLHPSHQLALHYGIYHQYLHSIPVSQGGLPVDYYTLSSRTLSPQRAHSLSLSYDYTSPRQYYALDVEVYGKKLSHAKEFNGSVFDAFTTIMSQEESILQGQGYNYGLNVCLKKNRGVVTGWLSYALSSSVRRFDRLDDDWCYAAGNRLHDLSAVGTWNVNKHINLSACFVYASGTPFTPVRSMYLLNNSVMSEYGKHNSASLPASHRLDVSCTWLLNPDNKRLRQRINVSFYNLYAHKNILFRYVGFKDEKLLYNSVYSLCRVLPSLGYSLQF